MNEIDLYVHVINYKGRPAVELRKIIVDQKTAKNILQKALAEEEFSAKIKFKNKFFAAVKLKQLGFL